MADAPDLGSGGNPRAGSTPVIRILTELYCRLHEVRFFYIMIQVSNTFGAIIITIWISRELLANGRAVMKDLMKKFSLKEFWLMTIGIEIMVIGIYFFKFPNNFSFGGATGIAVILSKYTVGFLTKGNIVVIVNILLLIIGFIFL